MNELKKPKFVKEAIEYLESILNKSMRVFEWGSGGSTQWFANRVEFIYSVEHKQVWFNITTSYLKGKTNYELIFVPQIPVESYAQAINKVGESFDLIVIDGRNRVACFKEALKCLQPRGYIVFDDINKKRYTEAKKVLNTWDVREFSRIPRIEKGRANLITGIYQKPY